MRNNVFTVMKKECSRIFNDRKLFFTTVILPGLLMFVIYSLIGTAMQGMFDVEDDYEYQVYAVGFPEALAPLFAEQPLHIIEISEAEIEGVKQQLAERETDVLMVFPANFDELVAAAAVPAPNVQVWANFTRNESREADALVTSLLQEYHRGLALLFSINEPTDEAADGGYNLASEADIFGMIVGMVVPFLFMIFSYTGCQALAPESIAGEKERGTLALLLVTPASRRDIALGKILGIGVFALMSAVCSILGAVLAMPSMLGAGLATGNIFNFYNAGDFVLLLLVVMSTTLVFVSLLSLFSAYARSVKEATSYAMPILMLVMVMGFVGMFIGETENLHFFLIPIMNSVLSIIKIFAFDANVLAVLVTVAVNVCVALVFSAVLTKMFDSEKIIFDK
ncbi:MAG: ABC transporter permease subunit [Defluviitaleaceae bacterium]|nr:ABC transporter permease subunit [Defluviitaleaceae bacterium]